MDEGIRGDVNVVYRVNPAVPDEALNELFATAWPEYKPSSFANVLSHSLAYICAYVDDQLVGFVNLAWDGGIHAFILDTTVHSNYQHRGIGRTLVERAAHVAAQAAIEWLHVDYEARLETFYASCGFKTTSAGLRNLKHPTGI